MVSVVTAGDGPWGLGSTALRVVVPIAIPVISKEKVGCCRSMIASLGDAAATDAFAKLRVTVAGAHKSG
jgi:hypothetical protein